MIDSLKSFCHSPRMNAQETAFAYRFLSTHFPSKDFLPVIGVQNSTMHQWAKRGYFHIENAGRGKVLYLNGRHLLYLNALHLVSKNSGSLKFHLKGLETCITFYTEEISHFVDEVKEYTTYCCLRFVLDAIDDYEWELTREPFSPENHHIVEWGGIKAEPIYTVIDLDAMLLNLAKKFEHLF